MEVPRIILAAQEQLSAISRQLSAPSRDSYSGYPVGVGRSEIAKWLFPQEKATLKSTQNAS
jgi:hypothetical protein